MTFEEAKKILKKEGYDVEKVGRPCSPSIALTAYESPEICEAMQVVCSAGYGISMVSSRFDDRKARLSLELAENNDAPGSGEEQPKEKKGIIYPSTFPKADFYYKHFLNEGNPALKESASQFNDALLDEQAKEIESLRDRCKKLVDILDSVRDKLRKLKAENSRIKNSDLNLEGLIYATRELKEKNKKIEELTREKTNLEDQITVLNACKEHNDKIDRKQIKRLGKEISKLNSTIHDKNAVLADVAEELRLSKIREKNLTEVSQKYMKENEELKKKLAAKIVDKIDAQTLKSAESALAYKEKVIAEKDKVIADLGKELKVQKGLVDHISKLRDSAKINLNLRMKECEKLEEKLEEANNRIKAIRNASKGYCEYGVAANEFIKELASLYVLANNTGIINDEILERCKNYQTYGFPANCNRETKKEINDIARGKTKVVGVDIAEEGADYSGVIVVCGKDFFGDAIKKMK